MPESVKGVVKKELSDEERREMRKYIRSFERAPYKWYVPNGACEDITRAMGDCLDTGKRIFSFLAANGVGKTTWLIVLLANLVFEDNEEKWFGGKLFKQRWQWPKKVWVITEDSTLNEVWDSIEGGIPFWWPAGRYSTAKGDKGRLSYIKTDTGWEIYFKTVDQDPRKFESTTLGLVIYDEPVSYKIHKGVTARLRRGGLIVAGATPLEHGEWMVDVWIENEDMEKYLYLQYASVYENMKNAKWRDRDTGEWRYSRRGRLTKEDIDFMISQYDETEIEARVWGHFKSMKGRVLPMFKKEAPFVIEPFDLKEEQVYCVIDPHDRRFPAIGWYAVDKTGQYFVVREWPNVEEFGGKLFYQLGDSTLSIDEIGARIKSIEKAEGFNVVYRWMDPNFGAKRYGNTGFTVQEEYERLGLFFDIDVTDDLYVGHSRLRKLLRLNNFGQPDLQIFNTCKNHIWAFHRYRYDEGNRKTEDKYLRPEKVVEKAKDFVDVARYFVVNEVKYDYTVEGVSGWRARLSRGGRTKEKEHSIFTRRTVPVEECVGDSLETAQ